MGSGKSAVTKIARELGFSCFSCDEIYKEIQTDPTYLSVLSEEFEGVVRNGALQKKKLASIVFSSAERLKRLNEISHPLVFNRLEKEMSKAESEIVFAEVPILFEENHQTRFDCVFVVVRERAARIESVKRRDGLSEEEIVARIDKQFPYETLTPTDGIFFIENNGDFSCLKSEFLEALKKAKRSFQLP